MILHQFKRTHYNAKGRIIGTTYHGFIWGADIESDIYPTTTHFYDQLLIGVTDDNEKIYNGDKVKGWFGDLSLSGEIVFDAANFCFCLMTKTDLIRLSNFDNIELL